MGLSSDVQRLGARTHHYPIQDRITADLTRYASTHGPCMFQLRDPRAGAQLLEHLQVDQQPDVGPLALDLGTIGAIEVLDAYLTQGVRPLLDCGPLIEAIPRLRLSVDDRCERTKQGISRDGIEVAVHPHHAHEGP